MFTIIHLNLCINVDIWLFSLHMHKFGFILVFSISKLLDVCSYRNVSRPSVQYQLAAYGKIANLQISYADGLIVIGPPTWKTYLKYVHWDTKSDSISECIPYISMCSHLLFIGLVCISVCCLKTASVWLWPAVVIYQLLGNCPGLDLLWRLPMDVCVALPVTCISSVWSCTKLLSKSWSDRWSFGVMSFGVISANVIVWFGSSDLFVIASNLAWFGIVSNCSLRVKFSILFPWVGTAQVL